MSATSEQAIRRKRMRIVIEMDVPAKGFDRRKFNREVVAWATAFSQDHEPVLLTTEEV